MFACLSFLRYLAGRLCFFGGMVLILTQHAAAIPVQREILAIYDSVHEELSSATMVHYMAEMPLNHLGYIVKYHDIRTKPLPPVETMSRYRAVITWFTYNLENPAYYLDWAAKVSESGTRFIILGSVGADPSDNNLPLLNRVLARIGVRYTTDFVSITMGSKILFQDEDLIGFEHPVDPAMPEYPIIETISLEAYVALEVMAPQRSLNRPTALVTIGPGGAYVAAEFEIFYDEQLNRSRWIINPFAFFHRALGGEVFPIPDTTTVSGRRLYFSHVDGDGWINLVEMERYRNPPTTSAEVMLKELIEPFPDLPVTVGLVAGDLDPQLGGGKIAEDLARRIFALPHVEVGLHTSTHPFDWGFYENYSRSAELALLEEGVATNQPTGMFSRLTASIGLSQERSAKEAMRQLYVSGGKELPRAYMRDPFRLDQEVDLAIQQTEALAPPGKAVELYQWTGDTRAFEAVVKATRRAGIRNLNGGDSRFDDEYPSVGYVPPLSREAGSERQIYAVNSNENTYTNDWTEHFHGFLSLSETIRRTENPRRLKGVNVYYHTFSAEKEASLNAVRTHLRWARKQKLAPIEASRYATIADGFFSTKIERRGPWSWRVSGRDGLQTVRFDDAEELDVDLAASVGVIGRTRHQGSLYIALDETVPAATIKLKARDKAPGPEHAPVTALDNSRWRIWDLERDACGINYQASGYGPGEFTWVGFLPGTTYELEARHDEKMAWSSFATADADGRLEFEIKADAISGIEIRLSCIPTGSGA
ncbi:hypothetical protein [Chelativorans sp. Marseille-P2723]|uniref:hypothetical protein n=1 Tax=Chelativorans sp. Marseille-P2723 TaxID=2709133 RepID=UPI00156FCD3F|nr:hypothetical protein [Chelativorans sp. Marseille-P2723]